MDPFSHRAARLLFALVLLVPACGGGGGGGAGGGGGGGGGGDGGIDPGRTPDPGASSFQVSPAFGTPADGSATVTIDVQLVSLLGHPINAAAVELAVSGYGNVLAALPPTDILGRTHGTLASFAGEEKTLTARVTDTGHTTELGTQRTVFVLVPEHTYYVRESGSDANSGRAPLAAWRTLEHALASLAPGDTLHVGAGLYPGPLTIELDARGASPFVLDGDHDGDDTGDAGEVVIAGGGAPWALRLASAHDVVVQGFTLRDAAYGLFIQDSSGVSAVDCRLLENDVGLALVNTEDARIQDCRVSANRSDGIRVASSRAVRVENDLIYANQGSGLVLFPPTADIAVRYDTFYRNAGDQLREDAPGGLGVIEENILAEGGAHGLGLQPESGYTRARNLVWANSDITGGNTGQEIVADPLFSDPFGVDGVLGADGSDDDDFRMLSTSAALDAGAYLARDVLLATHEPLAARTSRPDQLLESSGADLPATNLGYHYPVPAPFRSLQPGAGSIAHALRGDARAHLDVWDRALADVTSARLGPPANAEIVFLEQRTTPLDRPEELFAAQVDTGSQGEIFVRSWDGRRWSAPLASPFVDGLAREELADQRFDVEYEGVSGHALFVSADSDGSTRFQVLAEGRWNAPAPVFAAYPGQGKVIRVELVPRRRANEIALVTLDDQRDLVVALWNGTSWSAQHLLETSTVHTRGWRPFDAAFESLSGDLVVAWGFNTFIEETRWATLERASGTWRTGQHPSTDAIGAEVRLSADPTSDRIAAAMGEGDLDNDTIVSVWSGSEWLDTAELTLAGPTASRLLETCWIGNTGVACTIFRLPGDETFSYALLLAHGWRIQPDVRLPGVAPAAKIRLKSLPDRNQLLGAVLDQHGALFGLRFDGQAFSLLDGGAPLATGLDPVAPGRAFDAVARRQ